LVIARRAFDIGETREKRRMSQQLRSRSAMHECAVRSSMEHAMWLLAQDRKWRGNPSSPEWRSTPQHHPMAPAGGMEIRVCLQLQKPRSWMTRCCVGRRGRWTSKQWIGYAPRYSKILQKNRKTRSVCVIDSSQVGIVFAENVDTKQGNDRKDPRDPSEFVLAQLFVFHEPPHRYATCELVSIACVGRIDSVFT